jgi:hypothetical protein
MAALSVFGNTGQPPTVAANPLHLLSDRENYENPKAGTNIEFEVLEANALGLYPLVGDTRRYMIGDTPFWATLRELKPRTSTHPGLGLMRNRPTLLGVLAVVEKPKIDPFGSSDSRSAIH